MHIAAEALRYAVTNASDARSEAWALFLGLEALHNVTGTAGLVARSALQGDAPPPSSWGPNPWYNSTAFPGCAHCIRSVGSAHAPQMGVAGRPLVRSDNGPHDCLCPHDRPSGGKRRCVSPRLRALTSILVERERVLSAMMSMMSYLVDHGLLYIDANGKHTLWGVFSPEYLNQDPFYWDERGLYSTMVRTYTNTSHAPR